MKYVQPTPRQMAANRRRYARECVALNAAPFVSIRPSMMGGQIVVGQQRIEAELAAKVWWAGDYSLKDIEENWPVLKRNTIIVACWAMARYGPRKWRTRWKAWADEHEYAMWRTNYGKVPMPPQEKNR